MNENELNLTDQQSVDTWITPKVEILSVKSETKSIYGTSGIDDDFLFSS